MAFWAEYAETSLSDKSDLRMQGTRTNEVFTELPKSLGAWARVLADNVHLRVGNRAPALGKTNALIELATLFDESGSFGADYLDVLRVGETIVIEATLQTKLDQISHELPCTLIARSEHGMVSDLRVYLDRLPGSTTTESPISERHKESR